MNKILELIKAVACVGTAVGVAYTTWQRQNPKVDEDWDESILKGCISTVVQAITTVMAYTGTLLITAKILLKTE